MSNNPSIPERPTPPDGMSWYQKTIKQIDTFVGKDKLVCAKGTHTLNRTLDAMYGLAEFPRFRHILVTENGQAESKLLGIVSLRDLNRQWQGLGSGQRKLQEIMTPFHPLWEQFRSVSSEANIQLAINSLVEPLQLAHRSIYVSALPILAPNSQLAVGIMSYTDVIDAMIPGHTTPPKGHIPPPNMTVGEIMQPLLDDNERYHAFVADEFFDVAVLIKNSLYRTIPVVNNDQDRTLQGLITDNKIFITRMRAGNKIDTMQASDLNIMYAEGSDYKGAPLFETVTPEQKMQEILPKFKSLIRPDALPVIQSKRSNRLVGMVSYIDIFRVLLKGVPQG